MKRVTIVIVSMLLVGGVLYADKVMKLEDGTFVEQKIITAEDISAKVIFLQSQISDLESDVAFHEKRISEDGEGIRQLQGEIDSLLRIIAVEEK